MIFSKNRVLENGFTLAEILITLGIIGVISAITIPQLQTNVRKQQLRTKFLKTYSMLQQTFKTMEANDVPLYKGDRFPYFYKTFAQYVKTQELCTGHNPTPKSCYSIVDGRYYTLNGQRGISSHLLDDGEILLLDGTLLLFENEALNLTKDCPLIIFTDLNGYNNQPNRLGYDLFAFQFVNNQLLPMGAEGTTYTGDDYCSKTSGKNLNGMSCSYKAMTDPNYFKNLDKAN